MMSVLLEKTTSNNAEENHSEYESRSRPADALVNNWTGGIAAAFDVTVTSPLAPMSLRKASVMAGTPARLAEQRKYQANDPKCGWNCTPLAVESYGPGVLKPGRLSPI
ncbi:hypothetical protein EMCRGX_G033652 [Ephydatia muelleri]